MTMRVVEGITGYWFYHLRDDTDPNHLLLPALCGAKVMPASIKLESWGKTPENYHIPEKWCKECPRLAALGKR